MRTIYRPVLCALSLLMALAGCRGDVTTPGAGLQPKPKPLGLVEVTISGIGSSVMRASASVPSLPASPAGPRYSLSAPTNADASGNGSIQLDPLGSGSFTEGARGSGGVRYIWATFRLRNAQSDGTAYDTPRRNLTFFAVETGGTIQQTAISALQRFDGSAGDASIAAGILPTGAVVQNPATGVRTSASADVLQVLTEAEAGAVATPAGVSSVLPYGFVVRNASDGSRTLPASPAAGQYDGLVTFAFKIPLQAASAADPFTVSAMFLAEDDSETRITQSLEEQTPAGEAAFLARASAIGASMKTVLPGSTYSADAATTRTVCSVRTAGASGSPSAYLIQRGVSSIALNDPFPSWPLWAGGSVARDLAPITRDASGNAVTDVPVQWSFGTAGVLAPWGGRGVRMLVRRDRARGTVGAEACGVSSVSVTLDASGFGPLASGDDHSLALKSDGTAVGWGDNRYGQTNVPTGLNGVVQVAARGYHSVALNSTGTAAAWGNNDSGETNVPSGLGGVVQVHAGGHYSAALKSDGTVVAWGKNDYGQTTVPAGLVNVVQIAGGTFHVLALKGDGTVVGWGYNQYGQANAPAGLTGVVQVAAGYAHSLALKSDGTVVAWGANQYRQSSVPAGLTGVVQVAAGLFHSLALKSDGTVVAWGNNNWGQKTVPAGLGGVVQVAGGFRHSVALKSDGTVVAWGDNSYGQTNVPAGLVATVP